MPEVLFESKTDNLQEFTYKGETIENFGHVQIVPLDYIEQLTKSQLG